MKTNSTAQNKASEPADKSSQYIIKRVGGQSGGRYVAKPGSKHSYTNIHNARVFITLREAIANRCVENEAILPKP